MRLGIVAALTLIAIAELDRLISAVVSENGQGAPAGASHSLSAVIGPLAFTSGDAWVDWDSSSLHDQVATWIVVSVALDLVFLACYAAATCSFIKTWARPRAGVAPEIAKASTLNAVVRVLIIVELVEAAFLVFGAMGLWFGWDATFASVAVPLAATAKWAALALLTTLVLRNPPTRHAIWAAIRRGWQAMWMQRLSAVAVLILAIMSCVPKDGVLDQLPDVQRQWIGGENEVQVVPAAIVIGLAALAAFALGRARTRLAVARYAKDSPQKQVARETKQVVGWWLVPVVAWAAVAVLAIVFTLFQGLDSLPQLLLVFGAAAIAFPLVPIIVLVWSQFLRKGAEKDPEVETTRDDQRARYAWLAGDVLAISILTVAGVGLVRSAAIPAALTLSGSEVPNGGLAVAVLVVAALLAIASPVMLRWLNPSDEDDRRTEHSSQLSAPASEGLEGRQSQPSSSQGVDRAPNDVGHSVALRPDRRAKPIRLLSHLATQVMAALLKSNDPNRPRLPEGALTDSDGKDARSKDEAREWRLHQLWVAGIMIAALVILLVLAVLPQFAGWLGPVATTVLAITCWTAALGAFAVGLQEYQPLALFRMLRLRATPVLTLAIVVPIVYSSIFGVLSWDAQPHLIRTLPGPAPSVSTTTGPDHDDAPTTDAAVGAAQKSLFTKRLESNTCDITVGNNLKVKPVLLVAAEGGGIRAAYWTGQSLEKILGTECLNSTVLVSSGVSGGSVGLSLTGLDVDASASINQDEPKDAAGDRPTIEQRLTSLAAPGTLATAVSGLLVGDVVASALGIKLPSQIWAPNGFKPLRAGSDPFGLMWRDRAALIETGWITHVYELSAAYTSDPNARTGITMLNSTDADSGCRVVVGDEALVRIDGSVAADKAGDEETAAAHCEAAETVPAASWWLGAGCLSKLDLATAAMLSARFPIVTPGGRLPEEGCDGQAQLIDGGYAEGTGMGTLADIASQATSVVRTANKTAPIPYVPIVVYLRNSAGFDLAESLTDLTAEPLVPLVGYGAKAKQLTDIAWLQRLSVAIDDVCVPGLRYERCVAGVEAVNAVLPGQLVVVSPKTRPAVVPPLGWALSPYSRDSLDDSLTAEADCERDPSEPGKPARLCGLLKIKDPEED